MAVVAATALVVVVVPLAALGRRIVSAVDAMAGVWSSAGGAIANTIWTSLVVATVVTVAAAFIVPLLAGSTPARARWLWVALLSPLVIPPFVSGFSWVAAYGEGGLIDDLVGWWMPGLEGPVGVVAVMAVNLLPIAVLVVRAADRGSRDLVVAARVSGATGWLAWRSVVVPLLRPGLVAAWIVTFVLGTNAFGIPLVLGTPARFSTMTTRIYSDLTVMSDAAAFERVVLMAGLLVVMALVVVVFGDRRRDAPVFRVDAAGGDTGGAGGSGWGSFAVAAFAVAGVAVPLLALGVAAVTKAPGLAPVWGNVTLRHLVDAWAGAGVPLLRSVMLAVAASVVVIGAGLAVVLIEGRRVGRLGSLIVMSFALPGSALAVAVLLAYGSWQIGGVGLILVAYVAKFWALGHRPIGASVAGIPPSAIAAARVFGATPAGAVKTVTLPLMAPGLAAAGFLVSLFALQELTMSSLLYGPGSETLAVHVLNLRQLGEVGPTAAAAVLHVAAVAALAGAALALRRRTSRRSVT